MTSLRYSPLPEKAYWPGLRPAWAPDLTARGLQLGFSFPSCPRADLEITIHLAMLDKSIIQEMLHDRRGSFQEFLPMQRFSFLKWLRAKVMGVSLKTEKRRSQQTSLVCHCPVFSFRPRMRPRRSGVRRAEGLPGMTTEDLHGNDRRSAPPANGRRWSALLPPICMLIPDHSSFSVLREAPMTGANTNPFQKAKMLQGIYGMQHPDD